jgi:hypothetical protein
MSILAFSQSSPQAVAGISDAWCVFRFVARQSLPAAI